MNGITVSDPASGFSSARVTFFFFICLMAGHLCCFPALAVPFPYGEPAYSATIVGDSELIPGNVTPLTIEITNIGHAPEKVLDMTDPVASSPVVGIGATLTLHQGTAPVQIIATPLTIPALLPDAKIPVTFPVIVPSDANAGAYTLDLEVDSQYAESVTMEGTGTNVFHYRTKNVTLHIPVTIKSMVRIRVDDLTAMNMSPGQNGRITAHITNIGQVSGKHATAEIRCGQDSPVIPFQGSYYLGNFEPGETREVTWRAQVQDQIDATVIPATLVISYEDKDGLMVGSVPVSIGIPVSKGPKFTIRYENPVIEPGGRVTVRVTYLNNGDAPAHDASAKIVPISPVSSPETGAILGTLLPGESAEAVYEFSLEEKALVKRYGVLTDVKYRGEDGMVTISDPMKIEFSTVPQGILSLLLSPLAMVIILGILLILGYLFLKREGRLV